MSFWLLLAGLALLAAIVGIVLYGRSRFKRRRAPSGRVDHGDLALVLALEKFQVGLYRRQLQELQRLQADEELQAGIRRALQVERQHVADVAKELRRLGSKTGQSGGVVGLFGMVPGELSLAGGPQTLVGFDVWAEERAIEHYRNLLQRTPPGRIRSLLVRNLVDEEYHSTWLQSYLAGRVQNTPPSVAFARGLTRRGTALSAYLNVWLGQLNGEG